MMAVVAGAGRARQGLVAQKRRGGDELEGGKVTARGRCPSNGCQGGFVRSGARTRRQRGGLGVEAAMGTGKMREDGRRDGKRKQAGCDGTVDDGFVCGGKMQEGGIFVAVEQRMRGWH